MTLYMDIHREVEGLTKEAVSWCARTRPGKLRGSTGPIT